MTYNLGIMGNHTYYANNILVHNKTVPNGDGTSVDECIAPIGDSGFFD